MSSDLPLVHLHATLVIELGGMSKMSASVRNRLSLTRKGKLQWKVFAHPSRAGRDASDGKKPWPWMLLFSLLEMGANSSRTTPLKCNLKTLDKFDPQSLKNTRLIFCDTEWPQYPLGNGEHWQFKGVLNYDTVLQLDKFCRKQRKWVEVTYVLLFISLRDMPDLRPKGADLGVKSSAVSCFLTLLLYLGLPTEQAENQGPFQEGLPQSQ